MDDNKDSVNTNKHHDAVKAQTAAHELLVKQQTAQATADFNAIEAKLKKPVAEVAEQLKK
jgi:hypothetical protein